MRYDDIACHIGHNIECKKVHNFVMVVCKDCGNVLIDSVK